MNTLATHPGQHAVIQQQQSFSPAPAAILPLQPATEIIHSRIDRFPNTDIRDSQQSGPSKVRSIAFQFVKDSSVASLGVVGFGLAAKTAIENPILTGVLLGGACLLGAVGANAQSTNETDTETNPVTDPIDADQPSEPETKDTASVCPYWASKQESLPEAGITLEDMRTIMAADEIDSALISIFTRGVSALVEGNEDQPIQLNRLKELDPIFGPGTLLRSPVQEDQAFQDFADQHQEGCSLAEFVDFQRTRFLDQNASFKDRLFRVAEVALWIQRSQGTIESNPEKPQISSDMLQSLAQRKTPATISPVKLGATLKLMARINSAHTRGNINHLLDDLGIKSTDMMD